MKSLVTTLILFALMLGGIAWNYVHVNRVCDGLSAEIRALPDATDADCLAAVQALNDAWLSCAETVEFATGYTAVDRISEQAATLLACASCGDLYGYRTALALLLDAVEDLRRPERLSLKTIL
ncbi:MAG: hypothetical protein IJW29_03470 [Clostridia bacterium]|nr:hypothetical protein [Clostridia bacterium]